MEQAAEVISLTSERSTSTSDGASCPCGEPIVPIKLGSSDIWPKKCPDCRQKEEEAAARLEEYSLIGPQCRALRNEYRKAGLEDLEIRQTFNNYVADDAPRGNKKAFEISKTFGRHGSTKGLILISTPGTGKTHLSAAAVKAEIARGLKVRFVKVSDLLREFRQANAKTAKRSEGELIDEICSLDILHLDDFGVERRTDYSLEALYAVIDRFYRKEKLLFATSNLSFADLAEKVDDRIASRLAHMCDVIEFQGKDWRVGR